jgi:hypothetical protein
MAKFAVDSSTLVVRFSFSEATITWHRTLRIPLTLVNSVSADLHPWETVNFILGVRPKSPIPEVLDKIADAAVGGFNYPPGRQGRFVQSGDSIVQLIGPRGAQVFTNVHPRRPGLRVDLHEAAPYIGFLVTYRDPEAAAANLRAAIFS